MFFADRPCLVTGGTGFVGSHVVEALLAAGARVRGTVHRRPPKVCDPRIEWVQADLENREDCRAAMRGISCVFHCAGAVAGAANTPEWAIGAIADNLTLTTRVVQAAWAEGVERLQLFSSSTGYPSTDQAVREEDFWTGPVHPAHFGYGWMRRYMERLAEFAAMKSPLKVALVRPTAVYGPYDDFTAATSHVIPALIHRAAAGEDPFVVWGTGDEVRDFLHCADLAAGCLAMVEKHAVCDPVNIGYGEGVSIRRLVGMILDALGRSNVDIRFDPEKPTTIPVRRTDCTKAHTLLGYKPRFTVEEGLRDTVRWYLANRPEAGSP